MISYTSLQGAIKVVAVRDTRPCDGCGRRARCAPNTAFGGLLCAECSIRITKASAALRRNQAWTTRYSGYSGLKRRGVTQFASRPEPCSVSELRELERAYKAFRREPTPEARGELLRAINNRTHQEATR